MCLGVVDKTLRRSNLVVVVRLLCAVHLVSRRVSLLASPLHLAHDVSEVERRAGDLGYIWNRGWRPHTQHYVVSRAAEK